MKRTVVILAVLTLMASGASAGQAGGSPFGCLVTAQSIGAGNGNFMIGLGLADANVVSGRFDYGLSNNTTGAIKFGLVDIDHPGGDDVELTLGFDLRYQMWSARGLKNGPFDMALGGFFDFINADRSSIQLGGYVLGSTPLTMSDSSTLAPYGRFNARVVNIEDRDSELEFGLNAGVMWTASQNTNIYGEFQFDGNDGVFFGVEFKIM